MMLKTDIGNKRSKNIALGRKRIDSGEVGVHNKFTDDNLRRKSKHLIIDNLMDLINQTIKDIYKDNIGQGILIKKLLTMKQEQIKNAYVEFNQKFLNKTLKDIFSEDICRKFSNYPPEHNKNLINRLLNENDVNKKTLFTRLFNFRFKDVLRHINKAEELIELNGLKDIDLIVGKFEGEPDYMEVLKYYILNFEVIIERKRTRKPRIKIKEEEDEEDLEKLDENKENENSENDNNNNIKLL